MSPSTKYNGKISSISTTTKAIKLTRSSKVLLPTSSSSSLSKTSKVTPSSSSSSSSSSLSTATALLTSNIDTSSLFEQTQLLASRQPRTQQKQEAAGEIASLGSPNKDKVSRTMPSFKIMSYQNIIALLTVLVCGLVAVNGLKCQMCGQYNEGVGSITPCLNYSDQNAHLYLKECSKKSEKYCVKYVSELSTVRDCATECSEKEVWETQTYCCTEDGCNGSSSIEMSSMVLMVPLFAYICQAIWNLIKGCR